MYRDPIGHRIKTINNLMRKAMDKKTGQRPDRVTLMHCWIIGFVQDREDSGLDTFPKDIEKEFSINRSTTSEMLKLMCKKGMIEREEVEYDARLKKIVLTESSRNHNRQIEDKMKEMHQKLIKDLSEEEINMFNGLIESYENQRIPFSTLEVVIKMYATRFKDKDILNQTFFYPYPENLINITDSGKGRKL